MRRPSLSPSAGEERAEGRAVHTQQLLARRALGHDDVREAAILSREEPAVEPVWKSTSELGYFANLHAIEQAHSRASEV